MRPESESELAEIVAGLNGPVRIKGGGTRGVDGPDQVLSTEGLRGITLYEPGALTLVAQAGTPLAEIEAALEAEGQQLAFEPMDHRALLGFTGAPTIGGVVAGNVSGPRRIQAGACRDFLLGVRIVDGQGQVIKNGGRVMKNVTGYDLVKLMAGSWGTLGVLTEVSLKVLPKPEASATLAIPAKDAVTAVRILSEALKSPFEVTGAAYDPQQQRALIRIEGFAESVSYRTGRLQTLLGQFGAVDPVEPSDALWQTVRDAADFADTPGDVWRISVKPGDAPEIAARAEADQTLFDWGGGLIWALVPAGTDLRARIGAFSGHATLVRAGADTLARLGRFQPESQVIAALTQGIRQKFDPRGVFNPGLMG
ncbi:glycolate oxidase subunit GlcE [Ruegeria arenilitoris]|uniref:Putative FAD-linked oxidoreductase n=1 Tax=Ruegeria arenilitoris TaxID=1173585 RepID=A0A238KHQ5_9RHOB|nr:glycolate oxidase subunit GlcE [Ruegeria arenilitoris]SMX42227.1 putative FAD-linked oxidoreductase [Ruegeria arenilitoris]